MAQNELVLKFEKNQQAIAKLNRKIEAAVGNFITEKQKLEEQNTEMRAAIYDAMEAADRDKFDGDLITITRVKPTKRTTFDSTRFKTAMPKTYAKFLKTSDVKGSIRIAVKA